MVVHFSYHHGTKSVPPCISDLPEIGICITFVSQNNGIPIMTEKFKKIERQYVLSDSSVNVYGFRLLTSGYQLDAYRKNPIGYYMHRREEGIALKWEDLHLEDDKVIGTPVINLSNARGAQLCDEAENGFLNAASVGHIVVLEYSTDPEMMLPGQTGPTITKWYNKECSLVDIPGNSNALTTLYDAQENELNLADMGVTLQGFKTPAQAVLAEIESVLQVDTNMLVQSIRDLQLRAEELTTKNRSLHNEQQLLQQQIEELKKTGAKAEVATILDRALEDRKITVSLRDRLALDYADNTEGLKALITAMPAYRSIAESLRANNDGAEAQWEWDDYEKNDPAGKKLKALRANDPSRYKELFEKKFAA